jgi:hypothetical protein
MFGALTPLARSPVTEFEFRQIAAVRKELNAECTANSHHQAGNPARGRVITNTHPPMRLAQ